MSIKTTLGRIAHAVESKAIAHVAALTPPGGYAFRVSKLIDAVTADYNGYAKQRDALIRKFGIPNIVDGKEDGTTMAGAPPENVIAFNDARFALVETETLIPYEPIIFFKLGLDKTTEEIVCPNCKQPHKVPVRGLSIADVNALGPLLVEDEAALVAANAPAPEPVKG